ncbi:MAG: hypothetical protein JWM91_2425 [Rhodospirillales bacterium]|nr:hypothetical protein [Rhodospirillales bacterium]
MDDRTMLISSTFAVIILIPISVIVAYLVHDQMKARSNRLYKTLAEHEILNNAGNRAAWMSGVIPEEGDEKVDRFASRVAPIAQLVMLAVLVAVILIWKESLVDQSVRQNERLAQLELQVHALTFVTPAEASATLREPDSTPGTSPNPATLHPAAANPMQQACANLIGRVADAYERGESSKIALSLEQLVNKLGCKNNGVP